MESDLAHHRAVRLSNYRLAVCLALLRVYCWVTRRRLVAIALVEHFGDIVACEPIARYARKQYPRDFIFWVCATPYAELLRHHPAVDWVASVPCLTTWIRIRKLGWIDRQIDLHVHERTCSRCTIPLENLHGDRSITLENYYNFGPLLPAFCLAAGVPPLTEGPKVYLPEKIALQVERFSLPEKYVVIHCRSNEANRDWSLKGWEQLVTWIERNLDLPVVEVGTASIFQTPPVKSRHNLCGQTSLLETAEIIAKAALFIGVDSGVAHFANAAQIPGVIVIGRYKSFTKHIPYTGFYGQGGAILVRSQEAARNVPTDEVIAAVEAQIGAKSLARLDRANISNTAR